MDFLRRSLAPVTDKAWTEIHRHAKHALSTVLTARKFVDVDGPKGLEFEGVPLGRLTVPEGQPAEGVRYGINQILPLMETRISFRLNMWELDNIERGALDPDLSSMEEAGRSIAQFEENAIYYGFNDACIKGLKESSAHGRLPFPRTPQEALERIPEGIARLRDSAVEGPYSWVVNPKRWYELASSPQEYPLKKLMEDLLEGGVILSPSAVEGFLVSERGGDFRLTLGKDFTIGYESHTAKEIQLYFTESFTFQVLDPYAVVVFE